MNTNHSNTKKPRYELQSVFSNGTKTPPQIVPVNEISWETTGMNRRNFLGAGLTAVAVLTYLQLSSCTKDDPLDPDDKPGENEEPVEVIQSELVDCDDIRAHTNAVNALSISPDGKLLVSGSNDRSIKLWSLPEGAFIKKMTSHTNYVNSLAISPDGKQLASGSSDRSIKLWSLPDGTLIKTLTGHTNYVNSLSISSDGKLLASGSSDRSIKLWSLPDGALIKTLEGNTDIIISLAISSDGKLLVSGSTENTIKLWSLLILLSRLLSVLMENCWYQDQLKIQLNYGVCLKVF